MFDVMAPIGSVVLETRSKVEIGVLRLRVDLSLPLASTNDLRRSPSLSQSTTSSTGENQGWELPPLMIGAHLQPCIS